MFIMRNTYICWLYKDCLKIWELIFSYWNVSPLNFLLSINVKLNLYGYFLLLVMSIISKYIIFFWISMFVIKSFLIFLWTLISWESIIWEYLVKITFRKILEYFIRLLTLAIKFLLRSLVEFFDKMAYIHVIWPYINSSY